MSFNLDAPEVLAESLPDRDITSFAADINRQEIHIGFDKGSVIDGVFSPIIKDTLVTVPPERFFTAIAKADEYANAMPAGEVSVYKALKMALYDELALLTGATGSVS